MQPDQFTISLIVSILSILSAVWWLGRKIGNAATKDDLTQLKADTKADMLRLEENVKADNIRLEENVKADMLRLEENVKADNIRLEERMKADNIRLEESLKADISRVEEKADKANQQASANEARLLSIGEKSDYIVRQVERIESRQYHQLAGNPESAIEEELDAQ